MKGFHRFWYFSCVVSVIVVLLSLFLFSSPSQAKTLPSMVQTQLTHIRLLKSAEAKIAPAKASTAVLPCLASTTVPLCYSPQQIQRAYGVQPLLKAGITGKGQTIVIVDDFQSPTISSDLALFDKIFGLKDPKLNIIAPNGLKPFDPTDANALGFAGEISLDVEWSHAIAPDATIDLVLGNPANDSIRGQLDALIKATQFAVGQSLGGVVSLSVGTGETCYSAAELTAWHQAFRTAQAKNISVFVSSGDNGAAVGQCDASGTPVNLVQGVSYPASDPLVSGVGGTTLFATQSGQYQSETTWNNTTGATGGGFSSIFPRPSYQNGVTGIGKSRGVPDVAYNADPETGVPVVVSSLLPGATIILPAGGTSAGAPQWAGITALAEQLNGHRLGFLNAAFYRIAQSSVYGQAFHDITTGNNTVTSIDANGNTVTIPGFSARKGWDAVTGVGTPQATKLAVLLALFHRASDGAGL